MYNVRCGGLRALAACALFTYGVYAAQPNGNPDSVCQSFGVDFQDEGSYFINTNSNESFSAVSYFEGCNPDNAYVMLVDVNQDRQFDCSTIPTTPDDVEQTSTCPIAKSQMESGDWILILFGNNGNGNPFAYERDMHLIAGPQQTTTYTPTITWNVTSTPYTTVTSYSTVSVTQTLNATTTFMLPSTIRTKLRTVTPPVTTVWNTETRTRTRTTREFTKVIITETKTASCTVPPRPTKPDPTCTYAPAGIFIANARKWRNHWRRADRMVDMAEVRRRIQARREELGLDKRAPDVPTFTVTADIVVNATNTILAPTSTDTDTDTVTQTLFTTLPPSTIYSGRSTDILTITAPTPTRSRKTVTRETVWTTKTVYQTYVRTKTLMPTESARTCRRRGGRWYGSD